MPRVPLATLIALLPAFPQGLWERRADYPIAATEVSAAAIDGKIYALCGLVPGASVNSLFIYDPRADSWTEGAPAPVAAGADHCNVAAAAGKLYLLGGIRIGSGFIDGNTHEYDPAANRWTTVARMNVPRGASGVAAIGTRIYVAGGLGAAGSVGDFEVFDTATRAWTRLPNMPTARDHLTAQAVNGRLYAIAGRRGADFNVNEEFDPATNTWRARAPAPTARGGLASGVINNRILVVGGEGNSGTPEGTFRQNEEYDPATDTWRSLASMPTPRHGLYGVVLDGRLFTPSGGERAGGFFSNAHEAFYLPPAEPPAITGLRNAASGATAISPGSLVSVFGVRLSMGEQVATRFPLPSRMNAVQARVDGVAVPLIFVSPAQANIHLPYLLAPGAFAFTVWNAGTESAAFSAAVVPDAPGIFTLTQTGQGQGAVLIAGTGAVAGSAGRPVRKGEIIEIYCTGLGAVDNPPPPGQPATGLARTLVEPLVSIGGADAEVLYSGLAPGQAGLYQVNARVPAASTAGAAVPVSLRMGALGRLSNTVTITVSQ